MKHRESVLKGLLQKKVWETYQYLIYNIYNNYMLDTVWTINWEIIKLKICDNKRQCSVVTLIFFLIFENSKEYFAMLNKFPGGNQVHVCSFLNFGVKGTFVCMYIW